MKSRKRGPTGTSMACVNESQASFRGTLDGNEWWQLLTMENRLLMLVKWAVLGNGCKLGSAKQDSAEYIVFIRSSQSHHFNLWWQNMLSVCRRGTRFTLYFAVYCSVQSVGLKAEPRLLPLLLLLFCIFLFVTLQHAWVRKHTVNTAIC